MTIREEERGNGADRLGCERGEGCRVSLLARSECS